MVEHKVEKVELDAVLHVAGYKGKYQIGQACLILLSAISCSFPIMSFVFIGYAPDHRCEILPNSTNFSTYKIYEENIVDIKYHKCSIEVVTNSTGVTSHKELSCINGFHYDSHKDISIVAEWDLVCDRAGLGELSQTLLMLGQGFGALIFTSMSDRYGRRPINLACHAILLTVQLATVFIKNIGGFSTLRFIVGAAQQGLALTAYAIFVELFVTEIRSYAGCLGGISWTVSVMMLTPIGYFLRDYSWRYLQVAIVVSLSYSVILYWLMDESLRWLIANRKLKEAEKILKCICKSNKTDFGKARATLLEQFQVSEKEKEHLLHDSTLSGKLSTTFNNGQKEDTRKLDIIDSDTINRYVKVHDKILNDVINGGNDKNGTEVVGDAPKDIEPEKYTVIDIFKHWDVLKTSLILCFVWTVNNLTYYGLFLTSSSMSGNRFLNYFLNALVELPAMFSVYFALKRVGRRTISVILHTMSGLALLITVTLLATVGFHRQVVLMLASISNYVDDLASSVRQVIYQGETDEGSAASVFFSLFGKFSITASFNCLFIYTPELYPTNMRNAGIGMASAVARVGGMLAPYSGILSQVVIWGPGAVFGCSCILASILMRFVPETSGRPLPTTITEMRKWKTTKNPQLTDIEFEIK